jgi:hypothetical protein
MRVRGAGAARRGVTGVVCRRPVTRPGNLGVTS